MAKRPDIKADRKPTIKRLKLWAAGSCRSFLPSSSMAPPMIGVDNRKENLAAVSLVRFLKRPAVIVIPDLETPGIRAIAWAVPINRASAIEDLSRFFLLYFSAASISMPNTVVEKTMISGLLRVCSIVL